MSRNKMKETNKNIQILYEEFNYLKNLLHFNKNSMISQKIQSLKSYHHHSEKKKLSTQLKNYKHSTQFKSQLKQPKQVLNLSEPVHITGINRKLPTDQIQSQDQNKLSQQKSSTSYKSNNKSNNKQNKILTNRQLLQEYQVHYINSIKKLNQYKQRSSSKKKINLIQKQQIQKQQIIQSNNQKLIRKKLDFQQKQHMIKPQQIILSHKEHKDQNINNQQVNPQKQIKKQIEQQSTDQIFKNNQLKTLQNKITQKMNQAFSRFNLLIQESLTVLQNKLNGVKQKVILINEVQKLQKIDNQSHQNKIFYTNKKLSHVQPLVAAYQAAVRQNHQTQENDNDEQSQEEKQQFHDEQADIKQNSLNQDLNCFQDQYLEDESVSSQTEHKQIQFQQVKQNKIQLDQKK